MDRFIVTLLINKRNEVLSLKSNMDRFIAVASSFSCQGTGSFKIQYG